MDKIQIFRIFLLVLSVIGFILCFIALLMPYWIKIYTDAYTGNYGLFTFCVNNHGNDAVCSDVMFSNVAGNFKTIQVFMCIGFSFYTLYITTAAIIFFWSSRWRVVRGMKYAAAVFALLSAIPLLVTVILIKDNHNKMTESLSYGWYIAIVSLATAFFAVPSYIVDAYLTEKPKLYKNNNIMNVRPRPTRLSEKVAQKMVDSFNNQIASKTGQLPAPLGLRSKLALLYDGKETDLPPRPTTPYDNDDVSLDVPVQKHTMLVPAAVEYRFGSLYDQDFTNPSVELVLTDDEFVHPPPKLISDNVSLTNILRKNFNANSALNSPNSSRRSSICLQSGQLDDSDLEVYMLSKGFSTSRENLDYRPPSREAFGKAKKKKKHKETTKIVGDKSITKISHDGLPTIKVIGPDLESHDYRQIEKENELLMVEKIDEDRPKKKKKRSSSSRSSRREKLILDNSGYHSYDDVTKGRDSEQETPMPVPITHEAEKRPRRKSSKHKKNRKEAEIALGEEMNDGEPHAENVEITKRRHSSKKKKHKREKKERPEESQENRVENFYENDINDVKNKETIGDEKEKSENRRSKKSKKKKRKKSLERKHGPYVGDDLQYDVVCSDNDSFNKNVNDCNDETLSGAIDEILAIPTNEKSDVTKL